MTCFDDTEKRALLAREVYWSMIGELERAVLRPSPESLMAWIAVVETLEEAG